MLKKMISRLVPTTLIKRIIGLCVLLLLILTSAFVASDGLMSASTPAPVWMSISTPSPVTTQMPSAVGPQIMGLAVSPPEVDVGEQVVIIATVINTGDTEDIYIAELKVNNTAEPVKKLNIAAGETQTLSFLVSKDIPGIYQVTLDELTGRFVVAEPIGPTQLGNIKTATTSSCGCCNPEFTTPSCCQ